MEQTILLGGTKKARRAYGFDEVALVPSALTIDPRDVDTGWHLGKYHFPIPVIAAALDAAVDPQVAAEMSRLGGFAVLNGDGLQSRYDDASAILNQIAEADSSGIIQLIQSLYSAPLRDDLILKRVREIKDAGGFCALSATPPTAARIAAVAVEAGADVFVVASQVATARHESSRDAGLDLTKFCADSPIPVIVGNCVTTQGALELMEAGAAAVLVGVGPGAICTTRRVLGLGVPQVTAIADCAHARDLYQERTGRIVPIIADGGMRTGGDIAKAIASGADALMLGSSIAAASEAPAPGFSWGMSTGSADLPRGTRIRAEIMGTLREILLGPAHKDDGTMNLIGALRLAMASCGAHNLTEMHEAELIVAPQIATEGKSQQRAQGVGQDVNLLMSLTPQHQDQPILTNYTPENAAQSSPIVPGELVLVLDFGAQYTQLIARRVRECHVYCEILPYDTALENIKARNPVGVIMSGGPSSVYDDGAPKIDPAIYELGLPLLGICYGMQSMAHDLGGKVSAATLKEFGKTQLDVLDPDILFEGLNPELICWMSHGDTVEAPPPGFTVSAATENCPVAAMVDTARQFYAVQFHPEVVHTPWGTEVIRNFLTHACKAQGLWTMGSFIEQQVTLIREQVGNQHVVCGLSGGIDSCTVAALVHKAIGSQLTCIFVNHGLLRKGESEDVQRKFAAAMDIRLITIDAEDRFLAKLAGVIDPERKRKIIGEEFVRVFEEESSKLTDATFLAQGTLYPDVIESGTKSAAKIKTHHNVGGLPENMNLKLVEPLRYLFKDEVRAVAEELGLPTDMVWRQPFPGPGLAIRITGEVTKDRLDLLRNADWVIIDEIKRAGLYRKVWQSFAVLVPTKSVGVMGDQRTYAYPIVIRAVTSEDAMTAEWARLPYDVLERISNRIVNEVPGVNRVVLDITSKPPATIEWE